MKKKTSITRITRSAAALVLALCVIAGLAAHTTREAVLPPSQYGWQGYVSGGAKTGSGKDAEAELARRGTVETVVKAVAELSQADPKAVDRTPYGTVDRSRAAQGYISFTAAGKARAFILDAPDGTRAYFTVAKGETVKAALAGGTGTYTYKIATRGSDGYDYVDRKKSFTVKAMDGVLAPYLVPTPYGDCANAPEAAKQAKELWDASKTDLENISATARWVAGALDYDKSAKTGAVDEYVDPDAVLERGAGVCAEHSVLLVATLRSQGVPACYAGSGDHAWVRAWAELSSWTNRGVTYSKGAWVTIEATSGSVLWPSQAEKYVAEYLN
ncbi:transglutaminase family protein [uncultured Alistipes sp.]|jgi:transglutaminase-like putative cysteine protease|uniref:transglutaminase-like domain-containing protein n=1 Tax=uncultured Alistipes sp. TaxID=538949 RepID=UPI0027296AE9|nr:transglutaminase family protein [uncultured Alistipes sp.]